MAILDRRNESRQVNNALDILPVLRETFREMGFVDHSNFTSNGDDAISYRNNDVRVLSDLKYEERYFLYFNNRGSQSANGYCIFPEKNFGQGLAFVKGGLIQRVAVTALHELGHLMGRPLDYQVDEEAKAYAFARAGANAIYDNNIDKLGEEILGVVDTEPDANHWLDHFRAHKFVSDLSSRGMDPLDLYEMLCRKEISVADYDSIK